MQGTDPLKIFLGSLSKGTSKPKLQDLFQWLELAPAEIIVPLCRPGQLAVAFATFATEEEALVAVTKCHGLVATEVSNSPLHAHLGLDNGSLFLHQLWHYITLGPYDLGLYDFMI